MLLSEKNLKIDHQMLDLQIGGKLIEQVGNNCKQKFFKFVGQVQDEQLS